jgi:agmatinase
MQPMRPGPQTPSYPFAGIPSFLRSDVVTDLDGLSAEIAVVGVPTDEGSPYLPGSRFAPRSIRENSLRFGADGYYDHRRGQEFLKYELRERRIVDVGDVDVLPTNVEETFSSITSFIERLLDAGALPVVLGGDHAISFPVVRAYKRDLHVIHFDAHVDYAPFRHGYEFTNGHAFRHIRKMGHVRSLTQVGIRSIRNPKAWVADSLADGNEVVSVEELRERGPQWLVGRLDRDDGCYVSIDVDVLDMPLVPGCVSAEPDGLAYRELRDCLGAIAEHLDVIGFDLVEVNPLLDVGTGVTSYLAAHTIVEFLGQITTQPRWLERRESRRAGKPPNVAG